MKAIVELIRNGLPTSKVMQIRNGPLLFVMDQQ
jgi:hypothetical protein